MHGPSLMLLTTEVGNAYAAIRVLLLLPYTASDTQLKLFPVATREEQCHVPLNYEAIMAITDFPMAVTDTARGAFPCELPAVGPNLKAVTEIPRLILIAHEAKECHVNGCHA